MKNQTGMLCAVLFWVVCTNSFAVSIDQPYEVGTWQGFCTSAVTYTFDDWCPNQYPVAVPLFDKYGFKATFYPIISSNPNWTDLKTIAANGHEVGSHTMTHTTLTGLATEEYELKNSQSTINEQIPGSRCITIAYPYCNAGSIALTSKYYVAARSCQGAIESTTPADFYNISSIICGSAGTLVSEQSFETKLADAAKVNGWSVFLLHGLDGDWGYSPMNSSTIDSTLTFLTANKEKYWVATFANVACYSKERDCISVKETAVQNNSITLQVTDTLPDSLFNYPVTIRRPLPAGWSTASVTQNGNVLASSVISLNNVTYVMFNAVPDNGVVTISAQALPVRGAMATSTIQTYIRVWADGSRLTIDMQNAFRSQLKVRICDIKGATVANYTVGSNQHHEAGLISLPLVNTTGSMLVVHLSDGSREWSQKCVR